MICALRITPARAGKTMENPRTRSEYTDHPRACGENYTSRQVMLSKRGSPPRVRGKPDSLGASTVLCRITPARAGKTPE